MKFDCPGCGYSLRSDNDITGKRVSCSRCHKIFVVSASDEDVVEMEVELADAGAYNPFGQALRAVFNQLKTMEWRFPFLHNLVSLAILFFSDYPTGCAVPDYWAEYSFSWNIPALDDR